MRVRLLDPNDRRCIPDSEGDVFCATAYDNGDGTTTYVLGAVWYYTDFGGQVEILGDDTNQVPGPEAAR